MARTKETVHSLGNTLDSLKLSVLVPCYNVEKYIADCVKSILNQTLKDIEIICINDGSTDSTLSIMKNFAAKDERIRIIDKTNSGYGDSMNLGLTAARGTYIGIVESDDFIESKMFETLYRTAVKNRADVVKSNFWFYWSNPERNELHEYFKREECNKVIIPRKYDDGSLYGRKPSIWSAIYKRSFLTSNNIKFCPTPGASYQDTSFTFKVYSKAQRMVCLYDAFLHYRQDNENSSVNNVEKKIHCIFDEYEEIERFIRKSGNNDLYSIYGTAFYDTCIWMYERLSPKTRYPFLKKVSPMLKKLVKKIGIDNFKFRDMWWKRKDIVRISENPYEYHMWRNDERYDQNAAIMKFSTPVTLMNNISEIIVLQENKKNIPRFSVIIPIYNVEKYLFSALDSLLYQSYENIEIICINDGSTDNSLAVVEEYAKLDDRIIIVNQTNRGLAAARNSGLSVAVGEYIIFLDSDDYLAENACEVIDKTIRKFKEIDAIEFGTELYPVSPRASDWHYSVLTTFDEYYSKLDDYTILNISYLKPIFCWRYCYKAQFLKDNNLFFDESVRYGEDSIFLFMAQPKMEGVVVISDKLYIYRHIRKDSLMMNATISIVEFPARQLAILDKSIESALQSGVQRSSNLLNYSCDFVYSSIDNCPEPEKVSYICQFLLLMKKYKLDQYLSGASDNCKGFYNYCISTRANYKKEHNFKANLKHMIARVIPPSRKIFYEHSARIINYISIQQQSISLLQQQVKELQDSLGKITERQRNNNDL